MKGEQVEFFKRFMGRFSNPLRNPRMAKCRSLYYLAVAADGPIVELGTYKGCGAIALAFGARDGNGVEVYTVDDYQSKSGWAGEPYEPEDEREFWRNVETADVEVGLVRKDVIEAAEHWKELVSLVFWDTGIDDRLEDDFRAWSRHLSKGGIFAVHDTGDRRFGSDKLFGDGWQTLPELPGYIYSASLLDR